MVVITQWGIVTASKILGSCCSYSESAALLKDVDGGTLLTTDFEIQLSVLTWKG